MSLEQYSGDEISELLWPLIYDYDETESENHFGAELLNIKNKIKNSYNVIPIYLLERYNFCVEKEWVVFFEDKKVHQKYDYAALVFQDLQTYIVSLKSRETYRNSILQLYLEAAFCLLQISGTSITNNRPDIISKIDLEYIIDSLDGNNSINWADADFWSSSTNNYVSSTKMYLDNCYYEHNLISSKGSSKT